MPRNLDDMERGEGGNIVPLPARDPSLEPFAALDLTAMAAQAAAPKAFAIDRLAPIGEVTLFTGPGSAGKSLLAQQMATAAAAGRDCLGIEVREGPALYLTCEDDAGELHWRQEHICRAMGVPLASLAGRLHLVSRRGDLDNPLSEAARDGTLVPAIAYYRLALTIRATGARLVFLDNVAHLFTGNENDRGEVTRFVNLLSRLAGETGAAIVLIGHPNKAGDSYSGSTAWLNAVRSQFTIDLERDPEGTVIDPDRRVLAIGKANYARRGDAVRFRWHDHAFWLDDELPGDTAAEMDAVVQATADNMAFLRCLELRNEQERPVSDSEYSRTYAPHVFADMAESKGIGKPRLAAAMDRLFRRDQIARGVVCTVGRKDREGLLIKCADPRADPALTPCADMRRKGAPTPSTHPPPLTGEVWAGPLEAPQPIPQTEKDNDDDEG